MLMNNVETFMVTSPPNRVLQRGVEIPTISVRRGSASTS